MGKTYLIKNAKVYTVVSEPLENHSILIKDKLISKIAVHIDEKEADEVIDAKGSLVFPGFIDAHCHVGLWEESVGEPGSDGNEMTDPICPQLRAIDAINPRDEGFENAVKGGVTTICTGPGSANVLGGTFLIMHTYGDRVDDMLIRNDSAMKCAFGENPKRSYGSQDKMPATRMAIAAMLRETLYKAKEYIKNKNSEDGVDFDFKYEALEKLINKEIPLKAHCHRADDIFTAIRIAKEFDLDLTLDHCTEGHLIAKHLKDYSMKIIMGPTFGDKAKVELSNKSFVTPKVLLDENIEIAIMTDAPVIPIENLPMCAALSMREGMPEDEALKTITINAAKVLKIDDEYGSIEQGKKADIVIWDKHPFDIQAKTKHVFIEGKKVYSAKL